MTGNSGTKVTSLNVDRLDSKDSNQYFSGKTHIDGVLGFVDSGGARSDPVTARCALSP